MTEELIKRLRYDCELALQLGDEACVVLPAADVRTIADRIEALAAENEALKKWHTVAAEEVNRFGSENEALRDALQFYADSPCNLEFGVVNECPYDDGDRARAALGETQ